MADDQGSLGSVLQALFGGGAWGLPAQKPPLASLPSVTPMAVPFTSLPRGSFDVAMNLPGDRDNPRPGRVIGEGGGGPIGLPSPSEQLRAHYGEAAEELGTSQVPISELIKRSGISKEAVHKNLLEGSKRGELNLHPSTVPLGQLTKAQSDAAIIHPSWDEPLVDVEYK